jgi:hypothetical protein
MTQPTPYQYVKLGSNLEFLRGICTASIMQTTSLAAFPELMENLPGQRYSVLQVVGVLRSLLVQLEEMKLGQALQAAGPFRPMIQEMEGYLEGATQPDLAYLNDAFAERIVTVSKQVAAAVRSDLGMMRTVGTEAAPEASGS